jgi:hypothetical protein
METGHRLKTPRKCDGDFTKSSAARDSSSPTDVNCSRRR